MNKYFRPLILSRHPSHDVLRAKGKRITLIPFKSVVRFGSTTEVTDGRIELNSVASIKISANKLLMKQKFDEAGVKTADYCKASDAFTNGLVNHNLEFPIVIKAHYGSKGSGNTLIRSQQELENWGVGKNLNRYIVEKFYNYGHEFRLHITKDGCFYTCRKALRKDVPESEKWHFHDSTCVWFLENNENFKKPNSWDDIVKDCVKALTVIGADILSFDVKVQTPTDKEGNQRVYQNYILLECNS